MTWCSVKERGQLQLYLAYTGQQRKHTSVPGAGFEPTTLVVERSMAVRDMDQADTGIVKM